MLTDPTPDADSRDVRAVVRRYLAEHVPSERLRALAATPSGYDDADWRRTVDMGWTALGLPEADGGAGYGAAAQCVLFEELGRSLAGGPLFATAGLALPVLQACDDAAGLIADIVAGTVVAFADGTRGGVELRDGELHGRVELVLDGQNADEIVVAVEDGIVVVPAAAASVAPVAVLDPTRRFAAVAFNGTPARTLAPASAARLAAARDVQAVHHAAQLAGGAARALEMTVEYLGTRHQFGRPIGSFQALQHRCTDTAVAVSLARELVYAAAPAIDAREWTDLRIAAPLALARAATAFQGTAAEAVQLHGGIGFTDEHDIGLYYRRAIADRDLLGSPVDVRERLAVAVGL